MVDWPRTSLMSCMLSGSNLAIVTSRMTKGEPFRHVQITRGIVEAICMSPKTSNNGFLFPLFIKKNKDELFNSATEWEPNISQKFIRVIEKYTDLIYTTEDVTHHTDYFDAQAILAFIYAILHSNGYRERYGGALKLDYPRIPVPSAKILFANLVKLGQHLIGLQLLETTHSGVNDCEFFGDSRVVSKVWWTEDNGGTVWVNEGGQKQKHMRGASGFSGVSKEIWDFHIGGYRVCEKWLKSRIQKKGKDVRPLTEDDIAHYNKIIFSINKTICIMTEIDVTIETHGGWPDAFITADT